MNFIIQFFYIVLYQPFLNGLILIYNYLPGKDFGLAVVVLTLLIKLILHPFTVKGLRSQAALANLQPKIKDIQEKYKGDPQKQNQAIMELYKNEKVNPFSGCLLLLLQLPILIALYQVFLKVLNNASLNNLLYSFVSNPGVVNPTFLWVFDLNNKVFIGVLAIAAGVFQYWQTKISAPKTQTNKPKGQPDFANMMQKQTLYVFPILSVVVIWQFGAVVGLYWVFNSIFSIFEQIIINKQNKNIKTKI